MKKFVSACLMAGLLTCAAGAAQVGTINNNYPGDTEAQAQMLYDLGLFKGTDKGFALEKSMTRAEASVMLTRLLGAEKTALEGNWKHPFTDVPQWADKYVGWLYQNGLTKGVSATLYGSQRNVTCGQYCIWMRTAIRVWLLSITMRYGRRTRRALSAEMRFRSRRGCSVRTTRKMAMKATAVWRKS